MNFRYSSDSFLRFGMPVLFVFLFVYSGYAQEKEPLKMKVLNGITSLNKTGSDQTDTWIDFKHTDGAFTVKMPLPPQEVKKELANSTHPGYPPYLINLYVAVDSVNLVSYLVRYNDYPAGLYLADKSLAFNSVIKELESKGKIIKAPIVVFKDGYEGRKVDLSIAETYMQIQVYARGNRIYLLMKQNVNSAQAAVEDQFFDSFHFEKYAPNKGVAFSVGNIDLIMPEKPFKSIDVKDEDSSFLKEDNIYYATNKNSGGVYAIEAGELSKYARIKELDSIYTKVVASVKSTGDSVYKITDFQIGNIKGKEYYSVNNIAGTEKRNRIWINNNQFYFQTANAVNEEISSSDVNDFFNSVKIKPGGKLFDLQASKAALIIGDLKSKDTLVSNAAYNALTTYGFEKSELPLIYSALKNKYTNDTVRNGTRALLIESLISTNDEHTVANLKGVFDDKSNADLVRASVLSYITDIDKNSYDWYFNSLFTNKPLQLENYWPVFSPLRDSLSYSAEHIDELVGLLDVNVYRDDVLSVLSNMIDTEDKTRYTTLIQGHKQPISAKALDDLDLFLKEYGTDNQKEAALKLYSYLNILPTLDLPRLTDEFTNKLLAVDSISYVHRLCMIARIKTGLVLDKEKLNSQLDSLYSRYDLMKAFNEVGNLKAVPLKYRKHEEFAKLLLYNYVAEDYDYPESIQLIGTAKETSGTYYVLGFSYTEEGVKKEYVGVVGPFDNQADELKFESYDSFTNYEPKKEDWQSQSKELIAELNKIK
ncbi:hypothetical protein [Pedobacter panaciterrae]|uniref:hypothetical protein n=1 Tax=Pedobacter panaciterrae TaxID=363849 RepID=UPI00259272B4|nr:hypothetical protein [uncultured Pedobacter sp.]